MLKLCSTETYIRGCWTNFVRLQLDYFSRPFSPPRIVSVFFYVYVFVFVFVFVFIYSFVFFLQLQHILDNFSRPSPCIMSVFFYVFVFVPLQQILEFFSNWRFALCRPWAFTLSPLALRICPWISTEELLKNFLLSLSFCKQHSFSQKGWNTDYLQKTRFRYLFSIRFLYNTVEINMQEYESHKNIFMIALLSKKNLARRTNMFPLRVPVLCPCLSPRHL